MKRKFYLKLVKRGNKELLLFLLLFFIGCNSKLKLDEDTAVKVYVEKIIVEEKYINQPDSINYHTNKIFDKYHTSQEELMTFLKNLEFKSEKWNLFFRKADEYLIQLKSNRVIE